MALSSDEKGDGRDADSKADEPASSDVAPSHTEDEEEEDDEDDGEDEEPRLKYASLTKSQGSVYRNGDATSAFLVAGDKMVIGTHNGNIHTFSLPAFQSQRVYHAHSASVTAVSISPFPPPLPDLKPTALSRVSLENQSSPSRTASGTSNSPSGKNAPQAPVPNTPSNAIYIGTSSIDGNVCVSSLVDSKDVILRNFGRPVQAIALSPNYKTDRIYVSGGMAGNLIVTTGGRPGTSSQSNISMGAAAAASGWLGTVGLGSNNGHDTLIHSGEGPINLIKWSLSGKFIVWVNEYGIKIMRSHLYLEGADSELAWKRVGHIDRPKGSPWDDMASVWKARCEWIDEEGLESEDDPLVFSTAAKSENDPSASQDNSSAVTKPESRKVEKLVVGWGTNIWILHIRSWKEGKEDSSNWKGGRVDQVMNLRTDCIISGISLYTPNLLLVLAYIPPSEKKKTSTETTPKRGFRQRQNALQPEMRIIDTSTKEEVCEPDTLNVSRYESLSASDYHLGVLPRSRSPHKLVTQRGALEVIGGGIWDAAAYPARFFTSVAGNDGNGSISDRQSSKAASGISADSNLATTRPGQGPHLATLTRGIKIFLQSPYDCVLATKPTMADHLTWLDDKEKYEEAWNLLDQYPEAAGSAADDNTPSSTTPSTPTKSKPNQSSLGDFLADDSSQSQGTPGGVVNINSIAEKEKRRIGDKWLQQTIKNDDWSKAGDICSKVLKTTNRWEHWIWVFYHAHKYDEIAMHIPTQQLQPPLPSTVYEVILNEYISRDRQHLRVLLDRFPFELFDLSSVILALEGKLSAGDVREDSVEDGVVGRDWRILTDSLAELYVANGRAKEALRKYIKLQDVDKAMHLITEYHLLDAVSDDLPGLILLRVPKSKQKSADLADLEQLTQEPISLLVDEALHGIVSPKNVISQLKPKPELHPYLYFYFRALWNGNQLGISAPTTPPPLPDRPGQRKAPRLSISSPIASRAPITSTTHLATSEGKALVSDNADLAVSIFAEYDRHLLMTFLKASQSYTLDSATQICEKRAYIPELVYLLSKSGSMKRALFMIIEKLRDVSQAISYAKEQDDPELWNDLLDYSLDKPHFIRALLEEVGTSIDPIMFIRRIPEGMEIEGLKDGVARMLREYELQGSVSEGVAKVFRGEVRKGMEERRGGWKRGTRFEVDTSKDSRPRSRGMNERVRRRPMEIRAGYCCGCGEALSELGYPCSHAFHLPCLILYQSSVTDFVSSSSPNTTSNPSSKTTTKSTNTKPHEKNDDDAKKENQEPPLPTFDPPLETDLMPTTGVKIRHMRQIGPVLADRGGGGKGRNGSGNAKGGGGGMGGCPLEMHRVGDEEEGWG
ncbi:Vacuolar protein sorting-associated protein 41 [Agyrium rufum]|nr:Vacuolar protein sorting-associated protein 41 [Agyrium rufum]